MAAPLLLAYMYRFQSDNGVSDAFSIVIYKYHTIFNALIYSDSAAIGKCLCNGNCDLIKTSLPKNKDSLPVVSTKNRLWFNFFNFIEKLLTDSLLCQNQIAFNQQHRLRIDV